MRCPYLNCANTVPAYGQPGAALSRWDNRTVICSECGTAEAFNQRPLSMLLQPPAITWTPSATMDGVESARFDFRGSNYWVQRQLLPEGAEVLKLSKRVRTNRLGAYLQPMAIKGKAARAVIVGARLEDGR